MGQFQGEKLPTGTYKEITRQQHEFGKVQWRHRRRQQRAVLAGQALMGSKASGTWGRKEHLPWPGTEAGNDMLGCRSHHHVLEEQRLPPKPVAPIWLLHLQRSSGTGAGSRLGALPATSPLGTSIGQPGASEGDEPKEVSPTPMPRTTEFTPQQWPVHGTNCPCKPNIPFLHTSAPSIILAVPPLMGKQPEK